MSRTRVTCPTCGGDGDCRVDLSLTEVREILLQRGQVSDMVELDDAVALLEKRRTPEAESLLRKFAAVAPAQWMADYAIQVADEIRVESKRTAP